MPILNGSHVASLPASSGAPSIATHEGKTYIADAGGLYRWSPGSPVETLQAPGTGVPVLAGAAIVDGALALFGGRPNDDPHTATDAVEYRNLADGTVIPRAVPETMPYRVRAVGTYTKGRKVLLFGGINEDGKPIRTIALKRNADPVRRLAATLPGSHYSLQAAATPRGLFIVGSGSSDWQPPKDSFDFLARQTAAGFTVESIPSLAGHAWSGTTAIPKDVDEFFFIGGRDGNGETSPTLWLCSEDFGAEEIGDVEFGGSPYGTFYARGVWAPGESAIYLIGGMVGGWMFSNPVPTTAIVRVEIPS